MPLLDLVDETYVVAGPARLRTLLCDEQAWRTWFPDLALRCFDDRAELGKRWTVSGALVGTCEIWLERSVEGTIVHAFVQADPPGRVRRRRRAARALRRRYAVELKRRITAVKDVVEEGRPPGEPPPHALHARPAATR